MPSANRGRTIIGLDVGTTSTIAIAMSAEGEVVASASRPSKLYSPAPGFAEADPAQWWTNACECLREIAAALDEPPAAISVTGMLPAVVALDAAGRPLRFSIQQSDARNSAEVEAMRARLDEARFLARTGQGLTQQLVAPKLRWLQAHEPELFARIAHVVGSYDYINFRLTGRLTIERNWALEAGFVDLANHEIDDELIAESGLPRAAFPALVSAHQRIGGVSAEAAAATGLPEGASVFGGADDHIASALAAGLTEPGDVLLKFGGAGDVIAISERPEPDRRLFLDYHLIPGLYAPNGCMASSGSMLRWLAELIGGGATLAELDAEAEALPPAADGVRMLPYFLGEKTPLHDPFARGSLTGLSLGHGRGHIWRAALEAVACGFRHHLDVLAETGRPARRLYASDGGSRSPVWMQIVADVCGSPVTTLGDSYGSSVGAAWAGAVGAGLARWGDVARTRGLGATFTPHAEAVAVYNRVYADYRALYETLKPFFARETHT